ncbi:MAG: hypothetical protein AAF849_02655 [Bacteroidota bacterium]
MKFMFKHLLLLALSIGMLSFTQIPNDRPYLQLPSSTSWVDVDTLIPVRNAYSKIVAHPDLQKHLSARTSTPSSETENAAASSALVVTRAIAVCKGNGHFIGGKPRFVSGTFRDTLSSFTGRDSIIVIELSILDCQTI